jgi:hypothetical protein
MILHKRIYLFLSVLVLLSACRKSDYSIDGNFTVITDQGFGIGTRTLKKDVPYLIDGFVFVNDGQILTIEAGTVIRFKAGQAERASALIVARGGKIIAEGTADAPIIFTAEADDLNGSVPLYAQGLWGGIIILGNAPVNMPGGESQIEGLPLAEPRGYFGGPVSNDNSGILRYVSIRHGGTNIGKGNEINGLTLGGVGSGTTVEFVEIISNKDDGVEFFGGTVNTRFMLVAFCGDDAFDYDMGYRGKGQFWCAIQSPASGDRLIEADGNSYESPLSTPLSEPVIYNATLIGKRGNTGAQALSFDTYAAGKLYNSILVNEDNGVVVEYSGFRSNSFTQMLEGRLQLRNNMFYNISDNMADGIFRVKGINGEDVATHQMWITQYFIEANNLVGDPGFIITDERYQLNPTANEAFNNMYPYEDPWFITVPYKGAFYGENWASGWTLLSQKVILE